MKVGSIRPFPIDLPLISALVHRFSPKTGTFPLPIGELGITLEDVTPILGVRSDGDFSYASLHLQARNLPPSSRPEPTVDETEIPSKENIHVEEVDIPGEANDFSNSDEEDIDTHPPMPCGDAAESSRAGHKRTREASGGSDGNFGHGSTLLLPVPFFQWRPSASPTASDGPRDGARRSKIDWYPYANEESPNLVQDSSSVFSTTTPLVCMDIVESYHPDRFLRNFCHPQLGANFMRLPEFAPNYNEREDIERLQALVAGLRVDLEWWRFERDRVMAEFEEKKHMVEVLEAAYIGKGSDLEPLRRLAQECCTPSSSGEETFGPSVARSGSRRSHSSGGHRSTPTGVRSHQSGDDQEVSSSNPSPSGQ
ncbi:hypothetical protein AMTR_s00009p00211850 [Amborella trichopoda]|uniref:Aminotransferase-like plant mobile domain-containing protein n=1 Tax=Amborella trichopoda TaxID=13333 RepID=W1NIA6_AMBTC|nr:hypothetical protein AMTR_s00009p00211850 [Amborella trichopoda]